MQNKESNKKSSYKFPMSVEKETEPFILTHKILKDRYLIIKEYYKKYNVTLNDVVLAAYYRVLYNMLDINSKSDLNIPIMVDMRRNLKDRNVDAFMCGSIKYKLSKKKFKSIFEITEVDPMLTNTVMLLTNEIGNY